MNAILGPPHTYSAATERGIRRLAKWLGCKVHTLQLALEMMAAEMWPSKWGRKAVGSRRRRWTRWANRRSA